MKNKLTIILSVLILNAGCAQTTLTPANSSTGLPKQMSDEWIKGNNRLINAVEEIKAQEIFDTGYKRILAETSPNGTVTYKELDGAASIIGIFIP